MARYDVGAQVRCLIGMQGVVLSVDPGPPAAYEIEWPGSDRPTGLIFENCLVLSSTSTPTESGP